MNLIRSFLALLFAGLALSGCATRSTPTDAEAFAARDPLAPVTRLASRDVDPALWLLSDADTHVYLFGTVHFLPPRLGWFDEEVRAAFDRSESLVLEIVRPRPGELLGAMVDLGMARDGVALRDRLDATERAQYEALLARLGMAADSLDGYEPWFAFITLYQRLLEDAGFDSSEGVEEALSSAANIAGKPVAGLETPIEQLRIFDTLSDGEQIELLKSVLADPDDVARQVGVIIGHWGEGDIDALDDYLARTMRDSETERALIARRNANWAGWIERRMAEPGTLFLAVGAAHLSGPGNVRALLAERGLNAKRIDY